MTRVISQNIALIFKKNLSFKHFVTNWSKRNYSQIPTHTSNFVKLHERSFAVCPVFGKLLLNSECSCLIRPLCPQTYPDANHALVTLWGEKKEEQELEMEADLQGKNDILKLEIYSNICEAFCEICLPIKYDIEADFLNNASIQVEKMEGDNIEINTQEGSIRTVNIKSKDVSFTTDCGCITADEVLQGNVYINARRTTLKAKRLQGLELYIQAGSLQTEIESSYMDKGTIFAQNGNINLKHLHGSTNLHLQSGKVVVTALRGSIQAIVNKGEADVHVSQVMQDSLIQIDRGSLHLSLSEASHQNLNISCPSLEVSSDMKSLGSESQKEGISTFKTKLESLPYLRAYVREGSIKLSIKDWFASLGIKSNT